MDLQAKQLETVSKKDYTLLELEVPDHMFGHEEDGQKYARFIIKLSYKRIHWEVLRRQKQIEALTESLSKSYLNVPALPNTSIWFGDKLDPKNLVKKQEAFQKYLRELIYTPNFYSYPDFVEFFDFERFAPFLVINQPNFQGGIIETGLSVRNAVLFPKEDLILVASHELFATQRYGSYFSNFMESSSKKSGSKVEVTSANQKCVGIVECMRRVDKEEYDRIKEETEKGRLNFIISDLRSKETSSRKECCWKSKERLASVS